MEPQKPITTPFLEWRDHKEASHCFDQTERHLYGTAIAIATITKTAGKQEWLWQFEPQRAALMSMKVLSGKSDNPFGAMDAVQQAYLHAFKLLRDKPLHALYQVATS